MSELTTVPGDEGIGDPMTDLVVAIGGIIAVVIAWIVDVRLAVGLAWLFFLGGLMLATTSQRRRPLGIALTVAGAATPVAISAWFWVWASAMVLGGSPGWW